jgi:carbon monoxide dehydrogenase subunit G
MAIQVSETFELNAPADRVWAFLIDPQKVVQCLPGAELLSTEDARTFTGRIRVKVGPVVAGYRGRARFEEIDESARRARMSGEGQETSGGGSAKMKMTSTVTSLDNGGARVQVDAEVDVVGRLVQFGRGMMEEVSRQLFQQFADCVRSRLEAENTASGAPPGVLDVSASQPQTVPTAAPPVKALPLLWSAVLNLLRRVFLRSSRD